MAKKDNAGWLAALALGLGALAVTASSNTPSPTADPRTTFIERLRARLTPHGLGIVSAELGYDQQAQKSVWVLGVLLRNQSVTTVHVAVLVGTPMSAEACDDVANRVVRWAAQAPLTG